MKAHTILALAAAAVPAVAELPPAIPMGPVTYDSVSYEEPAPAPSVETAPVELPAAAPSAPMAAPSSSESNGSINFNLYTSNYQVRGMGVTDRLSHHGFSSVDGSYTFPNRNLFGRGIHQRISGTAGVIWDAADVLGDTPVVQFNYAVGKEIFPNLVAELGYSLHRGGLEGYMARRYDGAPHRVTQDVNFCLSYDDHQRGFFGHVLYGLGFQGLNGSFFDAELGYRFADVLPNAAVGTDVELSAGIAPSIGYWGHSADGVDAYRIRLAVAPFSRDGRYGRDAHAYIKPWIQTSWSGNNAKKIDRLSRTSPVDHFQITIGLEGGYRF